MALPLEAQGRVRGEAGAEVIVVASDPTQWAAGGSRWWRVAPRTRLGGVAAAGWAEGRFRGRGELAAHFLMNPQAADGVGLYAGGGLAGVTRGDDPLRLLVVIGVDARPASTRGWFVEAGVAGGIRLAAGWRWRAMNTRGSP